MGPKEGKDDSLAMSGKREASYSLLAIITLQELWFIVEAKDPSYSLLCTNLAVGQQCHGAWPMIRSDQIRSRRKGKTMKVETGRA
eukprot:1161092-Pelagomonas_calceolata.AAC.4